MFEKISYLSKRIVKMDYKKFFNVINRIHQKTNKNRIYLFFDIVYCGLKYQAGYTDYESFAMYNLKGYQRKTLLTRGKNNHLVKTYNDPNYTHYFVNKNEFDQKFNKFLKREWLYLDGNNEEEFNKFIKDKKEIIVKPIDGTHGDGVAKIKPNKSTYKQLIKKKLLLVEEVIKQSEAMNKLNPNSVNTVRVITFNENDKCTIVVACLRIGNKKIIDNFNGGGMVVPINLKTHKVEFPAVDKDGHVYYKHPVTKTDIVGFEVPEFKKIEKLVLEASKQVPQVAYIGWDVAISEKGPCLVEGNEFPSHDLFQLPPHTEDGIGILPEFQKILKQ